MRRTQAAHAGVLHRAPQWRRDPAPVLVGSGVARFRDPRVAHEPLPPFPAYVRTPEVIGLVREGFVERPRFAPSGKRQVVEIAFDACTSFYGTGEQAGPLLRNGTRKVLWNTDAFGYDDASPSLYQSHPWVLAVRADGSCLGVIIESTFRIVADLGKTVANTLRFECDGPSPAVTLLEGATAQDVLRTLAALTGTMPMPPLWALGYQQCRWSYEPDDKVREVARGFRQHRIPCDVIWLDIDYMDRFKCFTFDRGKFPEPAKLNADLQAMGFHTVYMIDPGLGVDPEYAVYRQGHDGKYFVQGHDVGPRPSSTLGDDLAAKWGVVAKTVTNGNGEYHGRVWPGDCAFPDFTKSDTRRWWAGLYKDFLANGIDGVWNDMNEPAVFDGPAKTMPESLRHNADAELGGPGTHARYHNVYGMQMVRATREGIEAARPDKRPFVLTRSNFLGGHRYAATWTGDNSSDWRHLAWSISMALNLGLSGQPFCGPDIGGFAGNADAELFAKWMGVGALLPFARAHSVKDSKPHEPWSFGPECQEACRLALVRRYRLLPYLYTLFREASVSGLPVVRPVWMADPTNPKLRAVDDAFLIGSDVLVVANVHNSSNPRPSGDVYPRGADAWADFEPGEAGHRWLPRMYLRVGAVVPLAPAMEWTAQKAWDPLTLATALDDRGEASGTLYEDAGDGYAYRAGDFRLSTLYVRQGAQGPTLEVESVQGSRSAPKRVTQIILVR